MIAQGRVYRVLAFFFGDVGKKFIECRYSHLRFRGLCCTFEITLMLVNSDAALVSQAQAETHVCR